MSRLQKARYKKFHAKVVVSLGIEVSSEWKEKNLVRFLDVYFDDMSDLAETLFRWKYSSYMDFKKKFDGTVCRDFRMQFHEHPRFSLFACGINNNKSFKGKVTEQEVNSVLANPSFDEDLTNSLIQMWNEKTSPSS